MCSIDGNAFKQILKEIARSNNAFKQILKEIARSNNVTFNGFVIIFLLDYTCIIVNNICEYPLKCLLIEKIQN